MVSVLVASSGHKDYLSPREACETIARGLLRRAGFSRVTVMPMADGGDGTIEAIVTARRGDVVWVPTHDPLFRPRRARMGVHAGPPSTAVIEIAEAAGSALLEPHERRTMVATSYGVGELILAAVAPGHRRIVVGLGGSIVSDMGLGMAQALGVVFLDARGVRLSPICAAGFNALSLRDVKAVRFDDLKVTPADLDILVAADVYIPLLGADGQARTFGPQKGATPEDIAYLESGFANMVEVLHRDAGRIVDVPLAGAAGGLGAGLLGFLGARLMLGAQVVSQETQLKARVARHDVVIIGEGCLDRTTVLSKGPFFAGEMATRLGKHVVAVVGRAEPLSGEPFYDEVVACEYGSPAPPLSRDLILRSLEGAAERAADRIIHRTAQVLEGRGTFPIGDTL